MAYVDEVEQLRRELGRLADLDDGSATALSARFYTSDAFLAFEEDALLRTDWLCVGHIGELREDGDFLTTEIVGEQLLLVRDEGRVRALSNVCRHRGNRIADGAGNARRFLCAYHHWSYDRAGQLVNAPLMDGRSGFEPETCRLPEFRTEVWNGWIFVDLSGQAPPLAGRLAGLDAVIANYHPDERFLVFLEETEWACNWKCLFENFMEGYHLSAIHPTTLHPVTPTRLSKKMVSGDAWTGYHAHYDPSYPPRGPFHPDLTEEERTNSPMYGVFPNLVVGMATNFTLFMCLRPIGVDRVGIRWGVTGLHDDPEAQEVLDYVALCRAFNEEDREKLEVLQTTLATRHYPGGPLAPDDFEGTIWDFVRFLARRLAL